MSHSPAPIVSVLMPVYNAERYLREAVESIFAQTFRDFEFVIINDGSTDGSLGVLEHYAKLDNRIKLVSRAHTGLVGALNEGLQLSRGEFIARMDADDVSLPGRLLSQIRYLSSNRDVVCLSGDYELMDAKGRSLTVIHLPKDEQEIARIALAGHPPLCHGCAMIRRNALVEIGGYDSRFWPAEDMDLYLRLGEVGRLANLDEVLLRVRLHGQSTSGTNVKWQVSKAREAAEKALVRRGIRAQVAPIEPWRPGEDRASQHRFLMMCGWWAFNSGERKTAMLYGAKAVATRPLDSAGWRLLVCAAIKPRPTKL